MHLWQFSIKNILNNIRNYFLFICSIAFNVAIYYVFLSLFDTLKNSTKYFDSFAPLFAIGNIIILVFCWIFIWYCLDYFISKRHREIGLFLLLGIRKRNISFLLMLESFLTSSIGVLIGIISGVIIQRFFVLLLFHIVGLKINIPFDINFRSLLNTIYHFSYLIFLVTIMLYFKIRKWSLKSLFSKDSKPKFSLVAKLIGSLIGIIAIGFGYKIALSSTPITFIPNMIITLVIVVIGSAFFVINFCYLITIFIKKLTSIYFISTNFYTWQSLPMKFYKYKWLIFLVSILSATTLTILGTSLSMNTIQKYYIDQYYPYDLSIISENISFSNIDKYFESKGIDIRVDKKNSFTLEAYKINADLNINGVKKNKNFYEFFFLKQSSLNGYYKKLPKINNSEALFYQNTFLEESNYSGTLDILGNSLDIKMLKGPLSNYNFSGKEILVISDALFDSLNIKQDPIYIYNIYFTNNYSIEKSYSILSDLIYDFDLNFQSAVIKAYYYVSIGFTLSSYSFVALFVSFVFLISMGSVMYFKLLGSAKYDLKALNLLSKIGMTRSDLRRHVAIQLFCILIIPLVIGIVHSSIALISFSQILYLDLSTVIKQNLIIYCPIYILYYLVTLKSYYNSIDQELYSK